MNQSLAHPLGANFKELISFFKYDTQKLFNKFKNNDSRSWFRFYRHSLWAKYF